MAFIGPETVRSIFMNHEVNNVTLSAQSDKSVMLAEIDCLIISHS